MCMQQNTVDIGYYFGVVDLVYVLTFSIHMTHPAQKINTQAVKKVFQSAQQTGGGTVWNQKEKDGEMWDKRLSQFTKYSSQ